MSKDKEEEQLILNFLKFVLYIRLIFTIFYSIFQGQRLVIFMVKGFIIEFIWCTIVLIAGFIPAKGTVQYYCTVLVK